MTSSVMRVARGQGGTALVRFDVQDFGRNLEAAIADARFGGQPLSLMFVDLDYFKCLSDTLGTRRSRSILRRVRDLLCKLGRAEDVYHCGAEEFLVILPAMDSLQAEHIGERIRAKIQTHRFFNSVDCDVTVSIGVAQLGSSDSAGPLVQSADEALYVAKVQGRNRVVRAPQAEPGWSTSSDFTPLAPPEQPSNAESAFDLRWGARLHRRRLENSANDTDHGEPVEFI